MKDIKCILFSILTLSVIFLLCSCTGTTDNQARITIYLAGNTNGKFLPIDPSTSKQQVSIANVGGLINQRLIEFDNPSSLIQLGNTVILSDEKDIESVRVFTESAKSIGFEANLVSSLELKDSSDLAPKRADMNLPLVLSNVKPKNGVTPPILFESYHMSNPGGGRYVYFVNFITGSYFKQYDILNDYYEWVKPTDWIKDFIRTIRLMDIVVVYYQTFSPIDLALLNEVHEAQRISFWIIESSLFNKIGDRSKRPEEIKDINLIQAPMNIANLQVVNLLWEKERNRWIVDNQILPVGSTSPEHPQVSDILK